MADSRICRVIVDAKPQSGDVNMAVDAALLHCADLCPADPVVRVYRWAEPTVSLGYFQKDDDVTDDAPWADCPRVRRLTGGGAILHHHELTYSCVIPRHHEFRAHPLRLYDVMHRTIMQLLADCGATAAFRSDCLGEVSRRAGGSEPFLCFRRADPHDLAAVNPVETVSPKVVGSAQRRRRGTVLQHGSILLRASPLLPDLFGITDVFPDFDRQSFADALPYALGKSVAFDAQWSEYTEAETRFALEYQKR